MLRFTRTLLALGMLALLAAPAFAWPQGAYWVKQFAGNHPGTFSKTAGPMLQAPNGGGTDGATACLMIYIMSQGKMLTCGACPVAADHGTTSYLPELGVSTLRGVIKLVAAPSNDGSCDPTNFSTTSPGHLVPELCDGTATNACAQLAPVTARDAEYESLMTQCAGVTQFAQEKCQDP